MPLTLAAAAGALVALVRRTRADLVLLAFVTAYLLLASRASSVNDRYSIPLVVPALLFAARLVNDAVAGLFGLRWTRAWLPAVAMLALCAPVTLTLLETNTSMTRGDTRVDAFRLFEAHVPADSNES